MSGKGGGLASKTGYQGTQSVQTPGTPILTNITGAANNGAGLIRLTVGSTAGLFTGENPVVVAGVTGTIEANNIDWTITVVDATHVDLQGSAFVNAYTGGGTLSAALMASGPGQIQSLMAANFAEPDTYTLMFNLTTGNVLPVPTANQPWPPPLVPVPVPVIAQPTSSIYGVRCVATVNWKVEGNQVQRVFDIGSGVSITGVGQGVDVSIQDMTYTVNGPANVQYTVSAQVTKGTRPATALPPILIATTQVVPGLGNGPVIGLGPGISADFTVPPNSGINSVEITTFDTTVPETEPNFLFVQHFNGSTIASKVYSAGLQTGFVKLAPNATDVRIINRSGSDSAFIAVTWGIDG
jgi:hypothetical protein